MSASRPSCLPVPALVFAEAGAPGPPVDVDAEAESWPDAAGGVFARCHSRGGRHCVDLPGLTAFHFDDTSGHVSARPCPGVDRASVREAYRHAALPLVLQALGGEVLHASAVLTDHGVVAFCGASGSGKSTIAWGLHRHGHALWADDAVALAVGAESIDTQALPFDVRLRPPSASAFGLGARPARFRRDETGAARGRSPLAALCVLGRVGASSRAAELTRLRPAAAFPAVLAHAFCFRLGNAARKRLMLDRYLRLVARVPVYALAYADGFERLPAVFEAIESATSAPARAR